MFKVQEPSIHHEPPAGLSLKPLTKLRQKMQYFKLHTLRQQGFSQVKGVACQKKLSVLMSHYSGQGDWRNVDQNEMMQLDSESLPQLNLRSMMFQMFCFEAEMSLKSKQFLHVQDVLKVYWHHLSKSYIIPVTKNNPNSTLYPLLRHSTSHTCLPPWSPWMPGWSTQYLVFPLAVEPGSIKHTHRWMRKGHGCLFLTKIEMRWLFLWYMMILCI